MSHRPGRFGADVLLTVGGKVLYVLLGIVITVVIARTLGPSGQGVFAVAFNFTLMLVQLGSAGLPVSNPYFSARDARLRGPLVVNSLVVAVLCSVSLCLIAVLVKLVVPMTLPGLGWAELALTLTAVPAALTTLYLQGVLLGAGRIVAYNVAEVMQLALALAGLLIAHAAGGFTLLGVLAILAASRLASATYALVALRDLLHPLGRPDPQLLRQMLGHGVKVYLVALVGFVLIRVDILLVNALVGSADAGYYSIAALVAEGLTFYPIIVGLNLLPRIARTEGTELSAAAFRVVTLTYGLICLGSIPAVLVGVPLLFGEAYDDSIALYLWLLPGTLSLGLLNSLTTHYYVRGYPRQLMVAWALGLVGNLILNCALLGPLGVTVAPIVSSVTYSAVLVAHLRVFAHETEGFRALVPVPSETLRMVRLGLGRG